MKTSSRALRRVLIALAALAVLAAGCGNDSTTSAGEDAPTTTEHSHAAVEDVTYTPVPSLSIEVLEDPMSGWNLHASVENFRLAPEHVSTDPVDGEGHMHLYIDGEKITRLYGEWYALGTLSPGEHQVRVELSANDHATLGVDGVAISESVMVTVPGDDEMSDGEMSGHVHDISIEVSDGAVVGGEQTHDISTGDTVRLSVTADAADLLHVHGYDLTTDLEVGTPGVIEFVARFEGGYEVELEGSGLLLANLVVG